MESLRVYYIERQRLVAADLRAEQEYLLDLDRRHNVRHHAPGVVRGLRVVADERFGAGDPAHKLVEPGVAVDLSGRELILLQPEPVRLEDGERCADFWLIYCREPLRPRRPGRAPCSELDSPLRQDFPRWREFPRVIVEETDERVAPRPPVEGAVFLGRVNGEIPPDLVGKFSLDVAYTALRGGEVSDPAGRAVMQVGPRLGRDQDGFAVSVADTSGNLSRRVALDRRGGNTVNGTIELLNYRASAVMSVLADTARLLVEARRPGPAGEQIQVKSEEKKDGNSDVTKLTFLNSSREPGQRQSETVTLKADSLDAEAKKFNEDSRLVRLKVFSRAKPPGENHDREAQRRTQKVLDDRQVALTGSGGTLEFGEPPLPGGGRDDAAGEERRGCYDSADDQSRQGGGPLGFSFLPVAQPLEGQPLPRIYTATVQIGDRTVEQLRFDLGEKKEADDTERFRVGSSGAEVNKWLTVSGKCLVSIPGVTKNGDSPVSIQVTGSIEQSPIKPDPTDPIFRELLVAAWLQGLRSSVDASTVIRITVENAPAVVESGKRWGYTVRLTNDGDAAVTADRLLETLNDEGELRHKTLAPQVTVPAKNSKTVGVRHDDGEIFPEGDMTIKVMASGKIGGSPWWKEGPEPPHPFKVVPSPEVDFSDVPDAVPPNADWEHRFTLRNVSATTRLTLKTATTTEFRGGGPVTTNLLLTPEVLHPQSARTLGPVTHPGGVTETFPYTLMVEYEWENGPPGEINESREIEVGPQLEIGIDAPADIEQGAPWEFDVTLENVSDRTLKIVSLRHRLVPPNDSQFTPIAGLPPTLNPGDSEVLSHIAGTTATSVATPRTLIIEAEYQGDGKQWRPTVTTSINVTPPPPVTPN